MYGATIGKVGISKFELTTNQACCACSNYCGIIPEYLFYYLISHKKEFVDIAVGGAQPNISKEKIVNCLIPLPSITEQKAIVNKIRAEIDLVSKVEVSLK